MTPFSLFREAPMRIRSLPTLWKVLACSVLSTTLAVVLMAWQASRFCAEHHHHSREVRADCGPQGITVRSLGDDGLFNTVDEIWSH